MKKIKKIMWWVQFWLTVFPRAIIFGIFGFTFIDRWDSKFVD